MPRLLPALALVAVFLAACATEAPAPSTTSPPVLATAPTTPAPGTPATPAVTATVAPTSTASPPASTCRAGAPLTLAQTEGPFYSANPPQRATLIEAGVTGTRLVLSGTVVAQDCRPLANARVDFWQTDANGAYDNSGFRLRGYQLADAQGQYRLETIVPAEYPGRTSHIHVKVTPPRGPTLTSQLYLPDVARNASDGSFRRELLMQDVVRGPEGVTARFDFIVATR